MRTAYLMMAAFGLLFATGCSCTPVEADFFTNRPLLSWTLAPGASYRIECWDYDTGDAVADLEGYSKGTWRPEEDLDFEHDYRIEVWDEDSGENSLCGVFSIRFEIPTLILPADGDESLMSLEPELRWQVAVHPWPEARYRVEIARRDDFKEIYWTAKKVGGPGQERHFIGVDQIDGTEDDIDFVGLECSQVLDPEREYFWRVRTEYFKGERKVGKSPWSEGRRFFVPPQPTGEVLQDLVQLTTEGTQDRHPDVSVSYNLAYEASAGKGLSQIQVKRGKRGVAKIEFDPGLERFSTGDSIDRAPDWDSRGEGIAFSSNRGGPVRIWVKKTTSASHREVTSTNRKDAESPEHSPDGDRIAFVERDQGGTPWIWIIDKDGSKPTKMTQGLHPAWSHDGKRIAYVMENRAGGRKEEVNPYNVFVLDLDTRGGPTQLTDSFSNLHPAWSLDDRRIALSSNRAGNWDIWEMDSKSGEGMRQLTNYLGTDTQPVWTPDGEHIVFSSTRFSKNFDIWMGRVPPR